MFINVFYILVATLEPRKTATEGRVAQSAAIRMSSDFLARVVVSFTVAAVTHRRIFGAQRAQPQGMIVTKMEERRGRRGRTLKVAKIMRAYRIPKAPARRNHAGRRAGRQR